MQNSQNESVIESHTTPVEKESEWKDLLKWILILIVFFGIIFAEVLIKL